jgi:serine/threonine protein kinase
MHTQCPPIAHRYLTIENIMMGPAGWILADCGSATTTVYNDCGSSQIRAKIKEDIERFTPAPYRAPEMVDFSMNQPIGPKVDVWALGCILYKLCTFRDAFPDGDPNSIVTARITWPDDLPIDPKLKEAVYFMLIPDSVARPDPGMVLGLLASSFPQFVDQKWTDFVPPKPPDLTPKARARPAARHAPGETQRGGRAKHRAIDLREMNHLDEMAAMDKEGKAEEPEPASAHPKRMRVLIPVSSPT